MRISDWSSDVCSSDLQFAASAGRQQRQDFGTILHIDHQAHRLAKAASAGQLVRAKRVKAAIGRNEQELIRRLRVKSKGRSVPFLELELVFHAPVSMTLHRANPAALRHVDRDGLPLAHGFQRDFPCRRCFLYRRTAAAKLRLWTITVPKSCKVR